MIFVTTNQISNQDQIHRNHFLFLSKLNLNILRCIKQFIHSSQSKWNVRNIVQYMMLKLIYIIAPITKQIKSIFLILKRCLVENTNGIPLDKWLSFSSDAIFFSLFVLISFSLFLASFSFLWCKCRTHANSTKATTTKNRLVSKQTPSAVNFPEEGLSF